jgi:hypothetical protein
MLHLLFFVILTVVTVSSNTCLAEDRQHNAVIGLIFAHGEFWVDSYNVRNNIALLDGNIIDTIASPSHVFLDNRVSIDLGAASHAQLYQDHLLLERGSVQCRGTYSVQAHGLTTGSTGTSGAYRIALSDDNRIQLSVLSGTVLVKNSRGDLVASISGRRTLEFSWPDNDTDAAFLLTGRLQQVGGHWVLRDETTDVSFELTGPDVLKNAGRRVGIAGLDAAIAPAARGAATLVDAKHIIPASSSGCIPGISATRLTLNIPEPGASSYCTEAVVRGIVVTVSETEVAGPFYGGHATEIGPTTF